MIPFANLQEIDFQPADCRLLVSCFGLHSALHLIRLLFHALLDLGDLLCGLGFARGDLGLEFVHFLLIIISLSRDL